jgi:hypothetical protein
LYEAILIRKILGRRKDSQQLTTRLRPEPPLDEQSRKLRDFLGESLEPSFARVVEQGNSLTDTLKKNLGDKFSATSLSMRWINWAYQRQTYRLLAELERLHYRLLADCLDDTDATLSALGEPIIEKRGEVQVSMNAAARFGTRAKQVTSKAAAQDVIRDGIKEAQAAGLKVRLARFALRWSPSRRKQAFPFGGGR